MDMDKAIALLLDNNPATPLNEYALVFLGLLVAVACAKYIITTPWSIREKRKSTFRNRSF